MKPTSFPELLHVFFHDWLVQQRNVSHHTVSSYRDSWRLFLRFVASRKATSVAKLGLADFTAAEVLAFLQHAEQERQVTIGTRNCRLAALRSFFVFVADREPLALAQCSELLRIPTKQAPKPEIRSLDEDEISAILAQPDRSKVEGRRDHLLLAILYNTGARIQEALNLSPGALRLDQPFQARLFGKGRKERVCPLWPETVALLKDFLKRHPRAEGDLIFVNRYGQPLGAAGVRFKLKHYATAAAEKMPSLAAKRVSPHVFRHSTAVSLVAAGVDVTVIRSWLGHASLDTTNRYARADLETQGVGESRGLRQAQQAAALEARCGPDGVAGFSLSLPPIIRRSGGSAPKQTRVPCHLPSHNWILLINCVTASLRLRDQPVPEQGDSFGFFIHEENLLSQKHKAEGMAGSMQKLCGGAQAGDAAGRSAAQRPFGARNAGHPNRWNRRSANRKR